MKLFLPRFIVCIYIIISLSIVATAVPDCEDCVASCDGDLACISDCEAYCDGVPVTGNLWTLVLGGCGIVLYTLRKKHR